MVDNLLEFLREKHGLLVAEVTGESALQRLASGEPVLTIRGRDAESGLPKTITVTASELRGVLGASEQ